jgi:hypothetical protein
MEKSVSKLKSLQLYNLLCSQHVEMVIQCKFFLYTSFFSLICKKMFEDTKVVNYLVTCVTNLVCLKTGIRCYTLLASFDNYYRLKMIEFLRNAWRDTKWVSRSRNSGANNSLLYKRKWSISNTYIVQYTAYNKH